MELNLVWQIILTLVVVVTSFSYIRFKTNQNDVDLKSLKKWQEDHSDKNEEKMNACFKRVDATMDRITKMEEKAKNHLNLEEAEEKFVSKEVLKLHLEKIELTTSNISQSVAKLTRDNEKFEGKLSDILAAVSGNK